MKSSGKSANQIIGDWLRRQRIHAGLSPIHAAFILNWHLCDLECVESGECELSWQDFAWIVTRYGVHEATVVDFFIALSRI